jgi:hypothetical protein
MEWSAHLETLRTLKAQGLNSTDCAKIYGVSREAMAQVFSRYCLNEDCIERLEKDRRLVTYYRMRYGWSVSEIAFQLQRSRGFVRRELYRHNMLFRPHRQLSLFEFHEAHAFQLLTPQRA